MTILPQDQTFIDALTKYLDDAAIRAGNAPGSKTGGIVPLFLRADGTIDRAKTLDLPCYANMEEK